MGLDITAYANVQLVKAGFTEDVEPLGGCAFLSVAEAFTSRADGLVEGYYSYDDSFSFRAANYTGYSTWRERLATLVGADVNVVWSGQEPTHFGELINFTDCDGTIGAVTSAKLAADFRAMWPKAEWHEKEYFTTLYLKFWMAFDLAARTKGAVRFH